MSPSRPLVRLLTALGFALGVLLLVIGLAMLLFTAATGRSRGEAADVHVIVLAFFSGQAALGAWLVRRTNPDLVGRVAGGLRSLVRTPPSASPAVLLSVPGLTLAWYVLGALIMTARTETTLLGAMVAVFGYAVTVPILIAFRPAWWLNAFFSVVLGLALLVAALATAEWLHPGAVGQGAMVFLAPTMGYPALLALSGAVRWITLQRRR